MSSPTAFVVKDKESNSQTAQYVVRDALKSKIVARELVKSLVSPLDKVLSNYQKASTVVISNSDRVLSPKSAEVQRQIERLVSFRRWLEEGSENHDKAYASINTAIRILNSTLYSQTPVPVASTNSAGTASLFIDDSQIYGDIEINGNEVEYYIKGKAGDHSEVFNVESMPDELMPANLLAIMYKIYERNLE